MLRPARSSDIPFMVALQARPEFLALIGADDARQLGARIDDPDMHVLIWQPGHAPAGFALLAHRAARPHLAELVRVCLDTPGRGEGAALVAALIRHAFDVLGAERLWLDVAADNARARRLYERAGFAHEGTLRRHWRRRTGDRADLALYGLLREEWRAG